MNTLDLLNAYKNRYQLATDYAAAKHLGVNKQTVRNWARGFAVMDDKNALLVADKLGLNPA